MEQMIASWSMVKVHGLMVAGPSNSPEIDEIVGRKTDEARVVNGTGNPM